MVKQATNKTTNTHEQIQDFLIIIFSMLSIYFVISAFTGIWPFSINHYNSYSLQAQSWLHGRLDLGQNYTHLELAQYNDKFYVSFPPFPSFIMLPFVLLFGTQTPDHLITIIIGIIGAIYIYKLSMLKNSSREQATFLALFATIASNFLFIGFNGSVWFIAQTMSFTLSVMAIYYAATNKQQHAAISLTLWACAVGCRPFQAIYIPILLYLIYRKFRTAEPKITLFVLIKKYAVSSIGAVVIALLYMLLNYLRFGNILEFGHNYLPEFTNSLNGQFNFAYLTENISRLFRLPSVSENSALSFPIFDGVAFWLVSPVFAAYILYLISSLITKEKTDNFILIATPMLIVIHFLLLCLHKTMGGWQWGNRYTIDAIPFLIFAIICLRPNLKLKPYLSIMFFIGIGLNLAGTIAVLNSWL